MLHSTSFGGRVRRVDLACTPHYVCWLDRIEAQFTALSYLPTSPTSWAGVLREFNFAAENERRLTQMMSLRVQVDR